MAAVEQLTSGLARGIFRVFCGSLLVVSKGQEDERIEGCLSRSVDFEGPRERYGITTCSEIDRCEAVDDADRRHVMEEENAGANKEIFGEGVIDHGEAHKVDMGARLRLLPRS